MQAAAARRPALVCAGVVLTSLTCASISACHLVRLPDEPMGLLLITLDTTRADRLSTYGFMDARMPHLDRLAREGILFDSASSVAPLTLPAHSSLLTGLNPPRHGVRTNAGAPLAASHTTLAETLRDRGYRTAAFVGSAVLGPDRGLNQGFEHYGGVTDNDSAPHPPGQRRADAVVTEATRWLASAAGDRFFLWAHFYDAHRPYDPPEPFRSLYPGDAYLGEIAFVDAQIGRLLEALEHHALLDRTLVVVAGDHGESLGQHGERDHGIFVYDSVLHVPLIIRAPPLVPRRVSEVVRLIDVMPTVLDLLGEPPPGGMDGTSLVDLIQGSGTHVALDAYAESRYPLQFGWSPLRSLRAGRFKLIEAPRPELYDLVLDPFERRNVFDQQTEVAATLARRLAMIAGDNAAFTRPEVGRIAMPAEQRKQLAALGYFVPERTRGAEDGVSLPDAKDCIAIDASRSRRTGSVPTPSMTGCH